MGKRISGKTYYYLVESARVDGKPRIVSQQYLGSAEEIVTKLASAGSGAAVRTQHKSFGDLAAVWGVLQRLDVAGVIDAAVPRYPNAGASVGTYLALATANRVVAPCSKLAFADWWASTAGPRWLRLPGTALDHRRFWEAMDRLGEADLTAVETEIGRRVVSQFGLDLSGLVLDMTNFATFIDSANGRAPIAQQGKAKQKRVDLRLVGLGLVVTRDGGIPLVAHAYAGDRPDVTQFATVVDEIIARYRTLSNGVGTLTLVYDAGQNSTDNHAHIEASGIGFVGSLPPSDHPGLLTIARARYRSVDADRFPGLTHVDTTATALGVTRRAVLTHSKTLHAAQARGFDQTLAKAQQRLGVLADKLSRGKTRRPRPPLRPRSPRSANHAGSATSSPPPSPASSPPTCAWPSPSTPRPVAGWKPACSANGSCSPTATPGPPPRSWPPTAPKPRPKPGSASSRTPTWCRLARCTTGPTRKSASTSSTASSP